MTGCSLFSKIYDQDYAGKFYQRTRSTSALTGLSPTHTPFTRNSPGPGIVPELMGDDSGGEPQGITDLVQVIAKLMKDCFLAVPAGEQSAIGKQRIERAKESQAIDKITYKRIDGNHAFRFQFAEGDVYCPLIRAGRAKAAEGEIDTLANAHTGVTHQQKSVGAQILASKEFLLQLTGPALR